MNYLQDTSNEAINAELEQMSNLYDGRVLIINENFRVVKDTYGISEGRTIISEEVILCFQGENTANYDRKGSYIEMTVPIVESVSGTAANNAASSAEKRGGEDQGRASGDRING